MRNNLTLGERLNSAIRAGGYKSAVAFCEKYDLSRTTLSQHVNGSRIPNDDWIATYAKALGVNAAWLKTGEGEPCRDIDPKTTQKMQSSLEEANLIHEIRQSRYNQSPIEKPLLANLLEALTTRIQTKGEEMNWAQIAEAAADLYQALQQHNSEPALRKEMIGLAVDVYLTTKKHPTS